MEFSAVTQGDMVSVASPSIPRLEVDALRVILDSEGGETTALAIVDYKTSSEEGSDADAEYALQLGVYAEAWPKPSCGAAWCGKGTAWRFDYGRSTTLVELAAKALQLASPDARCYWLEQLRKVSEDTVRNVVARVPRMSDSARMFAETILDVNRRRVLNGCA